MSNSDNRLDISSMAAKSSMIRQVALLTASVLCHGWKLERQLPPHQAQKASNGALLGCTMHAQERDRWA